MGNRVSKILPLDKTVVTELQVTVADIHLRTKKLAASIAAKVPRDGNFQEGDYNVSNAFPLLLNGIKAVVIIHAFEPVLISLSNENGMLNDIKCSGLFVMYGSFDSVEVKAPEAGKTVRLTYLYS